MSVDELLKVKNVNINQLPNERCKKKPSRHIGSERTQGCVSNESLSYFLA